MLSSGGLWQCENTVNKQDQGSGSCNSKGPFPTISTVCDPVNLALN